MINTDGNYIVSADAEGIINAIGIIMYWSSKGVNAAVFTSLNHK